MRHNLSLRSVTLLLRPRAARDWWSLAAAALSLLAIVSLAAAPDALGGPFTRAASTLSGADPLWLWGSGASFGVALVCSACAWRCTLLLCGGRMSRLDASASYGVGSLVNSLLPAHAGAAVRVALFARGLPGTDRLLVASGIPAAVGAARSLVVAALVLAAAGSGVLPAWTALVLAGFGCAAVMVSGWTRKRKRGEHRLERILDVFRAVGRSPAAAVPIVGWLVGAVGARVLAVAAVAAALGVQAPLGAALVVIPALAVTAFATLTPAGIGVTSGAVAIVLHAQGADMTTALAAGIALNAVETAAGLTLGIASGLVLAFPSAAARRWTLLFAAAGACCTFALLGGLADLA